MKGLIGGSGFYTPEDTFVFAHLYIMAEILKEQAQDPAPPIGKVQRGDGRAPGGGIKEWLA